MTDVTSLLNCMIPYWTLVDDCECCNIKGRSALAQHQKKKNTQSRIRVALLLLRGGGGVKQPAREVNPTVSNMVWQRATTVFVAGLLAARVKITVSCRPLHKSLNYCVICTVRLYKCYLHIWPQAA
jgi:hypothetical protein